MTAERGPFVWIWMGDELRAQQNPVPHQEFMDHPDWDVRWGYLHIKGSYVHLHENLLDLSHLSFLHATTFGTPEYARAPVEMKIDGNDFQVWRHVECQLPPIYARPLGWEGAKAMRSSGSRYVSPGLHVNSGIFRNLDRAEQPEELRPMIKVAQLITPESPRSTHYWTVQARNFARGDAEMGEFMIQQQLTAFREDAFALERISELQELEVGPATPRDQPADRPRRSADAPSPQTLGRLRKQPMTAPPESAPDATGSRAGAAEFSTTGIMSLLGVSPP